MVGQIKRWLGIDTLRADNVRLANALVALGERIKKLEADAKTAVDYGKSLTSEPVKPKIVQKRANWKQFRSAAEKASDIQEEA